MIEKEKFKKCYIYFMIFIDSNVNIVIGVINFIEEVWKYVINY